jgi:hypothetical protein
MLHRYLHDAALCQHTENHCVIDMDSGAQTTNISNWTIKDNSTETSLHEFIGEHATYAISTNASKSKIKVQNIMKWVIECNKKVVWIQLIPILHPNITHHAINQIWWNNSMLYALYSRFPPLSHIPTWAAMDSACRKEKSYLQ